MSRPEVINLDRRPSRARRIVLIHALQESVDPCRNAFEQLWPEARISNLLDDSLPEDLTAERGELDQRMVSRFEHLTVYASERMVTRRSSVDGILFTCSAFGEAIEGAKRKVKVPVLSPFEAAFEAAARSGRRVGLLVSFAPALELLRRDFERIASGLGITVVLEGAVAQGALEALKAGDELGHDRIVAAAAQTLHTADVIVLCQFSLARAAHAVETATGKQVMTTPAQAVEKLKRLTIHASESRQG